MAKFTAENQQVRIVNAKSESEAKKTKIGGEVGLVEKYGSQFIIASNSACLEAVSRAEGTTLPGNHNVDYHTVMLEMLVNLNAENWQPEQLAK